MKRVYRQVVCLLLAGSRLLLPVLAQHTAAEPVVSISNWKFSFGDAAEWVMPGFDDSRWPAIKVPGTWEEQGFGDRNGEACYRARVFIPIALREPGMEGLRFEMGAIDDRDSVFVNGFFIGATRVFTEDRIYYVHYNSGIINWDTLNVVVVKVFDETGWGGMYRGIPAIKAATRSEFIRLDPQPGSQALLAQNSIRKQVKLYARAFIRVSGELQVELREPWSGECRLLQRFPVTFSGSDTMTYTIECRLPQAASYQLVYTFKEQNGTGSCTETENLPYALTPPVPATPVIGGARVLGVRPGTPVLYAVAATGDRPMRFTAIGLPDGLRIDVATGCISGVISQPGVYAITLMVRNAKGHTQAPLLIKAGEQLALTPPMGWSSWNVWGVRVDAQKIVAAAKAMVQEGLVSYGWSYINIDDGWQAARDQEGRLQPHAGFPDMRLLTDTIHSMGLKAGIYSSPGPLTCGNYPGSYKREAQDAACWAGWGFDFVKYDWCSYGNTAGAKRPDGLEYPYAGMSRLLRSLKRSMVFSLCQYGMGEVWKWGGAVGGNLWRTGEDITDTWRSIVHLGCNNQDKAAFAKPGCWNDPDMLVVGKLGWGELRPSRLSADEQYTHMTLWCMQAAPLLLGCDLNQLDLFTKNLLCNHEVIAVNQDPLGIQGQLIYTADSLQVYRKPLQDGSVAIAIVNLKNAYIYQLLTAAMLGIKDDYTLRDIWRQQPLGLFREGMNARLAAHGVWLLKATPVLK